MPPLWKRNPSRRQVLCGLWKTIIEMKAVVQIAENGSQRTLEEFVVLLRNTTWRCGTVERRVIEYLRRQLQQCGCTKSSIKDILEHFMLKVKQKYRFLQAIERLEKRGIIKVVFNPFSSLDELDVKWARRTIIGR